MKPRRSANEVTVYISNLQVGEGSGAPRDYDEYVSWAGRRDGLLCTLRRDEGAITLHGDGQGKYSSAEHGTDRRVRSL